MTTTSNPTVSEVLALVKWYYTLPGNSVGGSLHIVLDDGNIEDGNVRFCIDWARRHADDAGAAIGCLLLALSYTQRRRLYHLRGRYA